MVELTQKLEEAPLLLLGFILKGWAFPEKILMKVCERVKSKILPLLVLALMGAAAYWQMPCLVRMVTHHPCPGCGLTRALWALLHGQLKQALLWHPMVYSLPILAWLLLRSEHLRRVETVTGICIAMGFLFCWLFRPFWGLMAV